MICYTLLFLSVGLIIEETGGNYDVPFMVVGIAQVVDGLAFFGIKIVEILGTRNYEPIPTTTDTSDISYRRKRYKSVSMSH